MIQTYRKLSSKIQVFFSILTSTEKICILMYKYHQCETLRDMHTDGNARGEKREEKRYMSLNICFGISIFQISQTYCQ